MKPFVIKLRITFNKILPTRSFHSHVFGLLLARAMARTRNNCQYKRIEHRAIACIHIGWDHPVIFVIDFNRSILTALCRRVVDAIHWQHENISSCPANPRHRWELRGLRVSHLVYEMAGQLLRPTKYKQWAPENWCQTPVLRRVIQDPMKASVHDIRLSKQGERTSCPSELWATINVSIYSLFLWEVCRQR
jgi:hypothetical protein